MAAPRLTSSLCLQPSQEIESQLGSFTTKDLERLLYGVTVLFPPARHVGASPPRPSGPALGVGPSLLLRLQRVFLCKLPEFSDASIVPTIRALARLPGIDRSAALWDPIRDEVRRIQSTRLTCDMKPLVGDATLSDIAAALLSASKGGGAPSQPQPDRGQ